jgi:hypothetical protein
MNENSEQTAARDVLQSSELTARLLRRATVSPGLLDTTMLRQVLARLAGWDARPASLFDELRSRYRIDDDSIDVDEPLLMEQSWMANINAYLTNSTSFSSTINQFISGVAASQSNAASGANSSSRFEVSRESHSILRESHSSSRELHSSSVTSQMRHAGLPPLSTSSSNAPSSSSSGRASNPDARRTTPGDAAMLSPAAKFRISRSPARRAWDAAPADASDAAPRMVLKSSEASTSTASEEARAYGEEARPTKATSEKIEQPGATKSEHSSAISSSVKTPGDLPLARTQTNQSEVQRKLLNEGESFSQQVSKTDAIKEKRQPSQVEQPAMTVAASPERGSANPARDIKKTGSASNESIRFGGDGAGMDRPPQSNATSHPAPAQAHTLHPVSAPAKTLTAFSHETLPLIQKQIDSKQIDSSPAQKQSPDFVWRRGADASMMTNATASVTGGNPVQSANQAADKTSTIQSPHSQTIRSEAATRKDELRAGSGITTERILRNISRKLLIERERRGY